MSIERMADRSLPLANRVGAAGLVGRDDRTASYYDALAALVADAAAADRLARAASAWYGSVDTILPDGVYGGAAEESEMDKAEAAYRARMAQGVAHGA